MNIGIVSLGCAKNQVDLEEILFFLKKNGFETVNDPELADAILINTCGFITSAKQESIDAILEMSKYNKPLIVSGCLATRYLDELKKELPEVSLFLPLEDYPRINEILSDFFSKNFDGEIDPRKRVRISSKYEAYLRISDGCNNFCSFCAIPHIRGRFKSVPFKTLQDELDILDQEKVRSLTVISQYTSMYGRDINSSLASLVREIKKHDSFDFVKLMYLYPDEVTDELISEFKDGKITPYFDLPVQHFSDRILRKMARRGTREEIKNLIYKFRKEIKDPILRTTVMVGFPSETEEDIDILLKDLEEIQFDHLGCFIFSPEENTPSFKMKDQIPEKTKIERYKRVMKLQKKISYKKNKDRINKTYRCLITSYNEETYSYSGISNIFAADDIDGHLDIYSSEKLNIGDLVEVKIVNALVYDLQGEVISIIRRS